MPLRVFCSRTYSDMCRRSHQFGMPSPLEGGLGVASVYTRREAEKAVVDMHAIACKGKREIRFHPASRVSPAMHCSGGHMHSDCTYANRDRPNNCRRHGQWTTGEIRCTRDRCCHGSSYAGPDIGRSPPHWNLVQTTRRPHHVTRTDVA